MKRPTKINHRFEAARDNWLETERRRYFQDLNPLHAWIAVTICNLSGHPSRPLPQWCLDYVVTVAVRMRSLGDLNNPKTFPFAESGVSQDERNDRVFEWQRQKIAPADAVAMLPWVMGVTRPGWNAFTRHAAARNLEHLAASYDFARRGSPLKFLASAAKERNIQPDAVKRRIRQGRRVAKPAPLPPDRFPPE